MSCCNIGGPLRGITMIAITLLAQLLVATTHGSRPDSIDGAEYESRADRETLPIVDQSRDAGQGNFSYRKVERCSSAESNNDKDIISVQQYTRHANSLSARSRRLQPTQPQWSLLRGDSPSPHEGSYDINTPLIPDMDRDASRISMLETTLDKRVVSLSDRLEAVNISNMNGDWPVLPRPWQLGKHTLPQSMRQKAIHDQRNLSRLATTFASPTETGKENYTSFNNMIPTSQRQLLQIDSSGSSDSSSASSRNSDDAGDIEDQLEINSRPALTRQQTMRLHATSCFQVASQVCFLVCHEDSPYCRMFPCVYYIRILGLIMAMNALLLIFVVIVQQIINAFANS